MIPRGLCRPEKCDLPCINAQRPSLDFTPPPSQQWQAPYRLDPHYHSNGKTKELGPLGHTGGPAISRKYNIHRYSLPDGVQPSSCIPHTSCKLPAPLELGKWASWTLASFSEVLHYQNTVRWLPGPFQPFPGAFL